MDDGRKYVYVSPFGSGDSIQVINNNILYREIINKLSFTLFRRSENSVFRKFPGPVPVSLTRGRAKELSSLRHKYVACEKTDGTRYLLFFTCVQKFPIVCLINRAMDVFWISLDAHHSLFKGTVIDGELCVAKSANERGKMVETHHFVCFDLVVCRGLSCDRNTLYVRQTLLIKLLNGYIGSGRIPDVHDHDDGRDKPGERTMTVQDVLVYFNIEVTGETAGVRCIDQSFKNLTSPFVSLKSKLYYRLDHITYLVRDVAESATVFGNRSDGVIFIPTDERITYGHHSTMFKWKQPCDNTVDFWVRVPNLCPRDMVTERLTKKIKLESKTRLKTRIHREPPPARAFGRVTSEHFLVDLWTTDNTNFKNFEECLYSFTYVTLQELNQVLDVRSVEDIDKAVVECAFDVGRGVWVLKKIRHDRNFPNILYTIENTLRTIEENITPEKLCNFFSSPK